MWPSFALGTVYGGDIYFASTTTICLILAFGFSESGIGTSIASGAEMDSTLKYDQPDLMRTQSPPPYADFQRSHALHSGTEREFGKPRVMNLAVHVEEMTDV